MSERVEVPSSLKKTFKNALAELDEILGPPHAERAAGQFQVEIESEDEGTYVLTYSDGAIEGARGFADDAPLIACHIPEGGWDFVRELMQAAVDGYPKAPAMQKRAEATRGLKNADLEALMGGLHSLKEMALILDVKGVGAFKFSRGSLEEVTREVTMSVNGDDVRGVIGGGDPEALVGSVQFSGQRSLAAELAAAMGPAWTKIRAAK